jgi:hypothetical protein
MANKIYVFGIGGAGSRVIKSLALLCASGIEANGFDIVPIIIDPDEANGDVARTIELLKNYRRVRDTLKVTDASQGFFKSCIKPVPKVDNFRMPLKDVSSSKFGDYINYWGLDKPNQALASLLFSEDNLNTEMEAGFKGNPNIGSVVLNQFPESEYFKQFGNSFQSGDRIFIISSIFGGTGAAGFPLIVKNLREPADTFPGRALIRKAPIGAITVLPYFGVTVNEESKIDKSTFMTRTKAALSYYQKNISGNRSLNVLYYTGDKINKDYENNEGSKEQKNAAHFIELAAALSILDFARISGQDLSNSEDLDGKIRANMPIYKEFGIKSDKRPLTFFSLADITQKRLMKPLSQYFLFVKYLDEHLMPDGVSRVWAKNVFDKTFLCDTFYRSYLKSVNVHFMEWIKELAGNERSFSPFNLDADKNSLFNFVKGEIPKSSFFGLNNYDLYDSKLNRISINNRDIKNDINKERKFVSLFYNATKQLVEQKLNFK